MLFASFLFAAFWLPSLAQDFGIPSSWREFGTNRTKDERVKIAKTALDSMVNHINASTAFAKDVGYWGTAATVLSAMANFDKFTGQTVYKQTVTNSLNKASIKYAHFDQFGFNDDAMWWATASYYAYRAYGDTALLNHAIDTWEHVSQLSRLLGKITGKKTVPIQAQCNGVAMTGGVFWKTDPKDKTINSITTGLFLTLSAYLASASNGSKQYTNAALAAARWLKNANKDVQSNLILDTLSADCSRSPASWVFTYNTGKYLEGLSVLASVTNDDGWKTEMTNVAVAAMKNGPWQGPNAVITEGKSIDKQDDGVYFKSVYVRALNEIFRSSSDQSSLATLTHSYIDVQYNAILELAAKGPNYSSGWAGPGQDFTAWGQAAALDALVSAISANT